MQPAEAAVGDRAGGGEAEAEQQDGEREHDVHRARRGTCRPSRGSSRRSCPSVTPMNTDSPVRDERDRERHARAVDHAREDVAADRRRRRRSARSSGRTAGRSRRARRSPARSASGAPTRLDDRAGEDRDEDQQDDERRARPCATLSLRKRRQKSWSGDRAAMTARRGRSARGRSPRRGAALGRGTHVLIGAFGVGCDGGDRFPRAPSRAPRHVSTLSSEQPTSRFQTSLASPFLAPFLKSLPVR